MSDTKGKSRTKKEMKKMGRINKDMKKLVNQMYQELEIHMLEIVEAEAFETTNEKIEEALAYIAKKLHI